MFDWPTCSAVLIQPAARELLAALAPVLSRWGRWYVFGAQAVVVHGVPRLSADLDVTLALQPDTPDRFAGDMEAAGFRLRVSDPAFVRQTRVMPFIHQATGMPLDVVLAASGLEDDFLTRAITVDLGGTPVPVIHVEDLVVAKILAGRPKDIEDVRALWQLHGQTADAARIRRILATLEEALSQNDLVPAFDAVVRRTIEPG
jgi:hypothetical protein